MSVESIDANNSTNLNTVRRACPDHSSDRNDRFSGILNSVMKTTDLDQIFELASKRYHIPVSLLKAVAKAESNFNAKAESGAGAQGIMQLMPATAKSLGVTDPFDAEQNIMGGAKYLSQMLQKFDGNTEFSLAAYNAGPGNVLKYGGIPPFEETQNYVAKVMGYCDNNFAAGTVTDGPEKTDVSDSWKLLQNMELPSIPYGAAPDQIADFMKIYQYQLQKKLFEAMNLNENQSEDDI